MWCGLCIIFYLPVRVWPPTPQGHLKLVSCSVSPTHTHTLKNITHHTALHAHLHKSIHHLTISTFTYSMFIHSILRLRSIFWISQRRLRLAAEALWRWQPGPLLWFFSGNRGHKHSFNDFCFVMHRLFGFPYIAHVSIRAVKQGMHCKLCQMLKKKLQKLLWINWCLHGKVLLVIWTLLGLCGISLCM